MTDVDNSCSICGTANAGVWVCKKCAKSSGTQPTPTNYYKKFRNITGVPHDEAWPEFAGFLLAEIDVLKHAEFAATTANNASLPCLCLTCSRVFAFGGTCSPSTNSFVTACKGYNQQDIKKERPLR